MAFNYDQKVTSHLLLLPVFYDLFINKTILKQMISVIFGFVNFLLLMNAILSGPIQLKSFHAYMRFLLI